MNEIEAYLLEHEPQAIETLLAFCAIASVSTDPAFGAGIALAAKFAADQLTAAGFPTVEIIPTGGHPCVLAEWCDTPGAPTVLVYGHYDVQPPDPLD